MIGFILGFGALTLLDVPSLIKQKYRRELTVYVILMVLAFALILLEILHVPFFNPITDSMLKLETLLEKIHLCYS